MIHYVCSGGCLIVQDNPGFCPVASCYRYRNPLSQCDCTDGKHGDWLFRNHPDPAKARVVAKSKLARMVRTAKDARPLAPLPYRRRSARKI